MASSKKTAKGLNQWVEADKPQMNDFNADNRLIDSLLDKRANWVVYSNLASLGLKGGSETILSMASNMQDRSSLILYVDVTGGGSANIYPHKSGLLTITRVSKYRVTVDYRMQSNTTARMWIGMVHVDSGVWTGWHEVMTQKVQGASLSAPEFQSPGVVKTDGAPEFIRQEHAPGEKQAAGQGIANSGNTVEQGNAYSEEYVAALRKIIQDLTSIQPGK